FYEAISRQTRLWSEDRRGDYWHSADSLAMAWALEPEGVLEQVERPLAVETGMGLARGLTAVDWNRQTGAADNARILLRYDQARFQARVQAALAAG
ncbi:MAG: nucleoside hydrolase, partial [Pseudoxanthomonas sp.]|nr:nucleoside hydrolase [Pseudoxanthomonas sp.]